MNSQRWMSRQFFSFFITWGIFLPFWTGWLVHAKEISVPQASLIMSLGLVVRGLSTLFVFPFLSGKFSNKTLLNAMGIGTLVSVLCYIPANSFASLLAATILLHLFYPALMPALDSAAGILVQSKLLKRYGKSRSWGSIGFIISGMLLTVFTAALGDQVILWALLLGTLVLVCLNFMPAPVVLNEKPPANQTQKGGILQLFHVKHFGVVLVIVILLQAAHASYYSYGYIYLQEIHTPKYLIGVIMNIAVIAEIIFFFFAEPSSIICWFPTDTCGTRFNGPLDTRICLSKCHCLRSLSNITCLLIRHGALRFYEIFSKKYSTCTDSDCTRHVFSTGT